MRRRVEVVTVSGTSEGFTIEPVRGPDGRIDVKASALHARLHHDAMIPTSMTPAFHCRSA